MLAVGVLQLLRAACYQDMIYGSTYNFVLKNMLKHSKTVEDVLETGAIADKLQEILDTHKELNGSDAAAGPPAPFGAQRLPMEDLAADVSAPPLQQMLTKRLTGKDESDMAVKKYWEMAERTVRSHIKLIVAPPPIQILSVNTNCHVTAVPNQVCNCL